MKTLQESLHESLALYEAFRNLKVFTPDPYNGPVTICKDFPTTDPYNSDSEEAWNIEDTDWLWNEMSNGTGSIAMIGWCDDNIYATLLNKVHDEKSLHDDFNKNVGKWLEENKEFIGEDYLELYIDLDCGICVDMAWEPKDDGEPTLDRIWDTWINQFNNSEVDGDSSYCRCLVDLKKKKVIAGGFDGFNFEY